MQKSINHINSIYKHLIPTLAPGLFYMLLMLFTNQGRREGGFLGFRKPPSSSVHNEHKVTPVIIITNDINDQTFEAQYYSLGI